MKAVNLIYFMLSMLCVFPAHGASIIASVNGTPITDTDITSRTKLMARQGQTPSDNRRVALQNIIDDNIKLNYAQNFNVVPDDKTVDQELKKMNMTDLSASEREMARSALRAEIAWQIIVVRTIMPTLDVAKEDINKEKLDLEREHGLPIEMTIVRLTDIPSDIASKLTTPKSCDDAIRMAENLGGTPQQFTAVQYELSPDIRKRVVGLPKLTWSKPEDNSVLLVCSTKKTKEYKNLDDMIKQNTLYKQAMFQADQQLKQLRRRAVIIINDERYKL